MDDKKNENQKIMKYINTKLKDGEIPLMLTDVLLYGKSSCQEAKLVITSSTLYYLQGTSIKRYFKAAYIECIALTPHSNQVVIFYDPKGDLSSKEMVRFESQSNVKIIQDIITVRERFCEIKQLMPVMISNAKTLEAIANTNESSKSRLFGFLFKKKQGLSDLQNRLSGQGQIVYVGQKDFSLQIGQRMYNQLYKNVKLLYINSTQNFRFFQQRYEIQQLSATKKLFKQKKSEPESAKCKSQHQNSLKLQAKTFLVRKIGKQSQEQNKKLANDLKTYKNEEYKQQILFAIETEIHFEILTAIYEEERDCQSLITEHQFLSEKDLRSIFFKLIQMIENSNQIFYSLSPQTVVMGKDGVRISKIFSCLRRSQQIDYMSPQQLSKQSFSKQQIQLINLWRAGILMFQLAYGNVPFPIQYIVNKYLIEHRSVEINLPTFSLRTLQFQNFIKSVLRIQPEERGIPIQSQSSQIIITSGSSLNDVEKKQQKSIEMKQIKQSKQIKSVKQNWRSLMKKCVWLKYK